LSSIGCKDRRTIYLHSESETETGVVISPTLNLNEENEETQRTRISPLPPQVRRLNTSSSSSCSASLNHASGGEVRPHHRHDRCSISLSSGTGSESTHDKYPIPVATGAVDSSTGADHALLVHSSFNSSNRRHEVKYQQKPLAVNPLSSHAFMTQEQELLLQEQAACRNAPHVWRQSVSCAAPSSTSDLQSPLSRQYTNASLGQESFSKTPAMVTPRSEVRWTAGLLRPPHMDASYSSATNV